MSLQTWALKKYWRAKEIFLTLVDSGPINYIRSCIHNYFEDNLERFLLNYIFKCSTHPKCKDFYDYFTRIFSRNIHNGNRIPWTEVFTINAKQRQLIANRFCLLAVLAGESHYMIPIKYSFEMLMHEPKFDSEETNQQEIHLPSYAFLRGLLESGKFWKVVKAYFYYFFAKTAPVEVFEGLFYSDEINKKFPKLFISLYPGPFLQETDENSQRYLLLSTDLVPGSVCKVLCKIPIIEVDLASRTIICSSTETLPDVLWACVNYTKSYYIK